MITAQSITKRMRAIDVRMRLEEISGLAVTAKDAFMAYCQSREGDEMAVIEAGRQEEESREWDLWEDFGNWHNQPIF